MFAFRIASSVVIFAILLAGQTNAYETADVQPTSRDEESASAPALSAPAVPNSLDPMELPKPIASPAWLDSAPDAELEADADLDLPPDLDSEVETDLLDDADMLPESAPSYVHESPATIAPPANSAAGRTWVAGDTSFLLPIITVETTGPSEVSKNRKAEFKFSVHNAGDSPVDDALLVVRLPAHLRFAASNPPPAAQRGDLLQFRVGAIKPKEKRNISLSTIPVQRGTARLDTSLQLAASSRFTVQVREPKLEVQVTGPNRAVYGRPVTHKVRVTNTGDGPAANVKIRPLLPEGVVTSRSQGPLSEIGWLEPGSSQEVYVQSVAKTTGNLDFQFVAVADGQIESRSKARVVVQRPMLKLEIDGPSVTYLRRGATYSVFLTNPGDAPAENVQVVSQLPAGIAVTALDRPAEYDQSRNTLTWVIPNVAPGATELMRFKATTTQPGKQLQRVTAVASDGISSQSESATLVLSRPDLRIQIADGGGPIEIGGRANINIEVENRGTQTARNVVVGVLLADSLDVTASSDYQFQAGRVQFNTISLSPGQKQILKLHVSGKRRGEHVVRAILRSSASSHELTAEASVFVYGEGPQHIADRSEEEVPKELRLR